MKLVSGGKIYQVMIIENAIRRIRTKQKREDDKMISREVLSMLNSDELRYENHPDHESVSAVKDEADKLLREKLTREEFERVWSAYGDMIAMAEDVGMVQGFAVGMRTERTLQAVTS